MQNVWKKIKEKWLDYWQDDMLDRTKTHLSQYDKRSLLYGGFMVGITTVLLCSLGIFIGNSWADKRNDKAMEEILWTLAAYMALATEDEYEQIAQTIRNDLVYSQYGQDVENLIQYIPNTADGCCLECDSYMNRIHLVFLNTGETYGLDVFDSYEPIENQRNNSSTQINFGYDEISEAHITIMKSPNRNSGSADIDSGRGIVSAHKMKSHFCDDCIHDILEAVEDVFLDEAVIFDAEEKKFYPITEGDLQIGDYELHTYYRNSGYTIDIKYIGN